MHYICFMNSNKALLINVASGMLKSNGFNGLALGDVLKKASLPKGTLYHYFPNGKTELVEAAILLAAEEQAQVFKNILKGKGLAANGLKALTQHFIDEAEKNNFAYTCPITAVCLDVSSKNNELQKICIQVFKFWQNAIDGFLNYKEVENPTQKASRFLSQLEGALLLSKVHANNYYLQQLKNDVDHILA